MAQNPMAVLAAMLGGGFQGYGQAQQRREDNANRDRLFALEYDKFKQGNQLDRDRFGLDAELGRGQLGVQQGQLSHDKSIDFARLFADQQEGAANRATSTENTRISAGGAARQNENFDRKGREEQGAVYLSRWQMDMGQGGESAQEAYKRLTEVRRLKSTFPGISDGEAAYRAAQVASAPGNENYVQRARPALAGQSFGSVAPAGNGVAPTPQATQAPARTPAPGAVPQAAGQAPAPRPTSRAEWDQKADSLLMQGKEPEEIVALLGPRPLQ